MAAVSYTRTTWVQGGAPGISQDKLNNIEVGLVTAYASFLNKTGPDTITGDITLTAGKPFLVADDAKGSMGYGIHGSGQAGIGSKTRDTVLDSGLGVTLKANCYLDNVADKFYSTAGPAIQVYVPSDGSLPRMRYSTNTPAADATITWGRWLNLTPSLVSATDPNGADFPEGGVWFKPL